MSETGSMRGAEKVAMYPRPACASCDATTQPGSLLEQEEHLLGFCETCGITSVRWDSGGMSNSPVQSTPTDAGERP